MNAKWYGDKRDLVKWGSLLHLAKEQDIATIYFVAMATQNGARPKLNVDGDEYPLDDTVWAHFRCLDDISRLGLATGVRIHLESTTFTHRKRSAYFDSVTAKLDKLPSPKIVFLDPDTGIAGQTVTETHVRPEELGRIWQGLTGGDWLVLYQHSNRTKTWKEDKKRQFGLACGANRIRVYEGTKVAHDVVFFATKK